MAKEYNINVTGLMSKDFPVLANSKKEAEILAKRILTNTNLVDFNMCDLKCISVFAEENEPGEEEK
ncbi:MAG: hypothetical protein MJ168_09380 [Clostridia bacterium]|nr:hypothetical protein [Clostridia bacterium]